MPDLPPRRIYLDAAASTPLRAEALEGMLRSLANGGNPSAHHASGRSAAETLAQARDMVATVLNALPEEVVFTSGGTESINAAVKGVALAQREAGIGAHIVTTEIEHHAMLHSAQYLERFGFEVDYLPVDRDGLVDPAGVAAALRPDTVLVSVMYANNEVGTIQPIADLTRAVRERSREWGRWVPVHTDAVQAATALSLDVNQLGVDLLSLSAHKFGGPRGAGLLYHRRGVPFLELLSGGGQERQRRSGTENVAGALGLAIALRLAQQERRQFRDRTERLRTRLLDGIRRRCPEVRVNGHLERRLPHNLHLSFADVEGEAIVDELDAAGVECSAGAACTSATWEPSHVLVAMGVPLDLAIGSVRLTLHAGLSDEDIDYVIEQVPAAVARARASAAPLATSL